MACGEVEARMEPQPGGIEDMAAHHEQSLNGESSIPKVTAVLV